ncbi:hypothetical protein BHM03_00029490 [Ensete ventricosum]|nr:hypothetical protein BHM03_00029490 [Ensete ventricosum]
MKNYFPCRYKPEVGDIIVGRVIEIAPKRWRLEINFSQDAVLMLSSMNLPDGIQVRSNSCLLFKLRALLAKKKRRRTAVDELNMRSIFEENDVICVSKISVATVGSWLKFVAFSMMGACTYKQEVRNMEK